MVVGVVAGIAVLLPRWLDSLQGAVAELVELQVGHLGGGPACRYANRVLRVCSSPYGKECAVGTSPRAAGHLSASTAQAQ